MAGKSVHSYKIGLPIRRLDKENSSTPNLSSEVRVRKMNFAEGIDNGMNPITALKNYTPSQPKEMTAERLKICLEAGFDVTNIAAAFSAKPNTVVAYCSKHKIKLNKKQDMLPKPDLPIDLPSEPVTGDNDILPSNIEMAPDKFVYVFGIRPKPFPQIRIRKRGRIIVAGCDIDQEKRYVLGCTEDFTSIKLIPHEDGFLLRPYKSKSCVMATCRAIGRAIEEKGVGLSVKYRLDTETLEGELIV